MSLGSTPLANAFVKESERHVEQPQFPLDLFLCHACGHVQLLDIVRPELLFRNYVYVSGTSAVFVEHFRAYAQSLLELSGAGSGSRVVEIGSNDGTLLKFFQAAGLEVLGIDPATAIAESASAQGIPTIAEFFDPALARRLRAEGDAALVVANNVFAHADDLHAIVEGVTCLLSDRGLFVFEVSYLLDVWEKTLFDTIYHEHVSYHSLKPLLGFFAGHGLELVDALRVDTHGGSLRCIVQRQGGPLTRHPRVEELLAEEERVGLQQPPAFRVLYERIQERKSQLSTVLSQLRRDGRKIAGFGAPAKACTLMYHFGLGPREMDYIVDDSPLKQGLFSPGHHIPVVPSSYVYDPDQRPDYLLVLAWNFAASIMDRHQAFAEAGGKFIVPLPTVAVS